jgi:hypothetical protein
LSFILNITLVITTVKNLSLHFLKNHCDLE